MSSSHETKQTLYDLLGSNPSSTQAQILAEYRTRVLDVHPDKTDGTQNSTAFHELNKAKEILTTPALRQHYDLYLKMGSGFNMNLDEWMQNREKLQQTLHWAQSVEPATPMLPSNSTASTCKSQLDEEFTNSNEKYPRRFTGWTSHSSPLINAFRNYQI